MKKNTRVLRFICTILAILAILSTSVFAASSSNSTVTVYGYTYTYYSTIFSGTEYVQGSANVSCSKSIPDGYAGLRARIYNSSGTLKAANDWSYNESSGNWLSDILYHDATSGYYYCKAQVQFYNGNGYNTYTATKTPNLAPMARNAVSVVTYNDNGEIYGSDLFLGEIGISADLILAEGKNGTIGYVKRSDLEQDEVTSLEEALEYQVSRATYREIPLYEENGETVIDVFVVNNSSEPPTH